MKAMFVNQQTYSSIRYADLIVNGYKDIETRGRNMLSALVGERVAVVRTIHGKKPMIVGYVDVIGASFCKTEDFDKYFNRHCVCFNSKYAPHGKGKWFYYLANAEACDPFPLPASAIRHGRSWCEF